MFKKTIKQISRKTAAEDHSQIKNPPEKQWTRKTSAYDFAEDVFLKKKSFPRKMLAEGHSQLKNPRKKTFCGRSAEDSRARRITKSVFLYKIV